MKKLPLLLNLTQFYIPSHNSNLKMNLYETLHFCSSWLLTFGKIKISNIFPDPNVSKNNK